MQPLWTTCGGGVAECRCYREEAEKSGAGGHALGLHVPMLQEKKATTFDVNDTSGKITENRMIAVGLMADACALLTQGVDEGCVELSC